MKFYFLILIFVILAGLIVGGFYLVFRDKGDKVCTENCEALMKDVLVRALDEKGNMTEINVTVVSNFTFIKNLLTRNDSYQKIQVPSNHFYINVMSTDRRYYSDMNYFIGSGTSLTIKPNKVGDMKVEQIGNLSNDNNKIVLNISTNRTNRELSFCAKWSVNIIEVTMPQFPKVRLLDTQLDCEDAGFAWIKQTETCSFWCKIGFTEKNITAAKCEIPFINKLPPTRLKDKVFSCWYGRITIKENEPLLLNINYRAYPNLDKNDYIEIYIIDSDFDLKNVYRFEDENFNDVAAKDIKFIIK